MVLSLRHHLKLLRRSTWNRRSPGSSSHGEFEFDFGFSECESFDEGIYEVDVAGQLKELYHYEWMQILERVSFSLNLEGFSTVSRFPPHM